jgi:hypothetical protein
MERYDIGVSIEDVVDVAEPLGELTRDELIAREWAAALADAELDAADFCLIVVDGPIAGTGRFAVWHEPGLARAETEFLKGDDLVRANSDECLNRHLVAVWRDFELTDFGVAFPAGRLRHELEHARQWNALGVEPFELDELLGQVLLLKVENTQGAGYYYTFKPIEQDANAAASMFVRRKGSRPRSALYSTTSDRQHWFGRRLSRPSNFAHPLGRLPLPVRETVSSAD